MPFLAARRAETGTAQQSVEIGCGLVDTPAPLWPEAIRGAPAVSTAFRRPHRGTLLGIIEPWHMVTPSCHRRAGTLRRTRCATFSSGPMPRRRYSWRLHLRHLGLGDGIPSRWRLSRAASTVRPVRRETSSSGNLPKRFSSVVVHH